MSDYSQPRLSNAMTFLIFAKNALRLVAARIGAGVRGGRLGCAGGAEMSFSIRFPELPPRSHDAPSFRRYALRGRRIGWALDSQKADCRPKFDRWTALAVALGVMALILALWPSAKVETHAPKIRWVHVMLG